MLDILALLPEAYIVIPVTCVAAAAIWLVFSPQQKAVDENELSTEVRYDDVCSHIDSCHSNN